MFTISVGKVKPWIFSKFSSVEKAEACLERAGWKQPKDGFRSMREKINGKEFGWECPWINGRRRAYIVQVTELRTLAKFSL